MGMVIEASRGSMIVLVDVIVADGREVMERRTDWTDRDGKRALGKAGVGQDPHARHGQTGSENRMPAATMRR